MSTPVFYTVKGELTAYAFACGYVESGCGYRLFKDGCYHLQGFPNLSTHLVWLTFSTLKEAREAFRAVKTPHEWDDVYNNQNRLIGRVCLGCDAFEDVPMN